MEQLRRLKARNSWAKLTGELLTPEQAAWLLPKICEWMEQNELFGEFEMWGCTRTCLYRRGKKLKPSATPFCKALHKRGLEDV